MTTPPEPSQGGGHRSLMSRLGGSRNASILAAGATVAVVALFASLRSKSAGASGTTTTITGDTAFDSGPYDMWNQWQEEYEALQQQVNAIGGGTTTATGPGQTPLPPMPPKTTLPAPISKPPIPTPAPMPRPPAPTAKAKYVTIQRGDTLSKIASKNHISMTTLKKLNPTFWKNPKYHNGNTIWSGGHVRVK